MSTEPDLISELRAGFASSTEHLTYTGRRRPRRTAPVVLPLAAASLAFGAIAVHGLSGPAERTPAATGTPTPTAGPTSSRTSPTVAPLVTEKIELAGFTVRYQRRAGAPEPLHVELRSGKVPSGLDEVTLPGGRLAFSGRDPRTGANAVFVEDFVRAGGKPDGRLFVLLSSTMSPAELVTLFDPASARPVPLVED